MKFNYEVEAGEFISAGNASSKFKKALKQLGLKPEFIRRISVAMYEAEINMVIHANGGQIEGEITPENIKLFFVDQGPGIPDLELAMKEGYSTASKEARNMGFGAGMGLPNIKKNSDDMQLETILGEGTTLRLTFKLN